MSVISRFPRHIDAFWIGQQGQVSSAWAVRDSEDPTWKRFQVAPPGLARPGALAALSRHPQCIQIFWIGGERQVLTASYDDRDDLQWRVRDKWPWRDLVKSKGEWVSPSPVSSGGTAEPGAVTAVARHPEHMDVFWIGPDGEVRTGWWDSRVGDDAWLTRIVAPSGIAEPGAITAIARGPEQLDVFWIRPDQGVASAWWNSGIDGGSWHVFELSPPGSAHFGAISAVARGQDQMDVFWIGPSASSRAPGLMLLWTPFNGCAARLLRVGAFSRGQ